MAYEWWQASQMIEDRLRHLGICVEKENTFLESQVLPTVIYSFTNCSKPLSKYEKAMSTRFMYLSIKFPPIQVKNIHF
jgi:hypothetical protein